MIQFSTPINEISAINGVLVTQNGAPVAGAFSFQNNDTQLIFTPTNPYLAAPVTVATTPGVTDNAGNVIANTVSFTFTVDTPPLTSRPFVSVANPPNNTIGVGRNITLQAQFNTRINPLTVTPTSFVVVDNNSSLVIPGTLTVTPDRRTVSFVASSPYAANERYCWYLDSSYSTTSITDLYGNTLTGFASCFTTGTGNDTTAPVVTQVTPPNGATGVPLNTLVSVQVSKPLSQVAFPTEAGGVVLPLTVGPGPQGGSPADDLGFFPGGTSITVKAGGRGSLCNCSWQVNPDGSIPAGVTVASPWTYANAGATNYPTTAGGDGTNHFPGGGANIDSNGKYGFAGAQTTDTTNAAAIRLGTLVGTFKSQPTNLDWFVIGYGTTVTVPAGGADLYLAVNDDNNTVNLGNFSVQVTTSASPVPAITLSTGGTAVAGAVSLSADRMTLNFVPAVQLAASADYTINVQNATDYVGNVITPFSSSFSTGTAADTTNGIVLSFNPPNGQGTTNPTAPATTTPVPVNSTITITYSKFVDPLTVNASNIYIYTSTSLQISGSYSVDNTGTNAPGGIVTFTPSANLPSAATINVYSGYNAPVTDFSGNSFGNKTESFKTAGTAGHYISRHYLGHAAEQFDQPGLEYKRYLTFSKPLNPSTINNSTFNLFNGTTRLNPSVSYSADYQVVTLSQGLPNNATITVVATSGVQDLAGNALADFSSTFTTVQLTSGTRPSVTGERPGSNASSVPASSSIVLFVNEALNPSTVNGAFNVSQNGTIVPGTVALSGNNQVVTFTPAAPFTAGAYVQVFFSTAAKDTFGNALNNFQYSFTVAPSLTSSAPVITSTVPYNGAGNRPIPWRPIPPSTSRSANRSIPRQSIRPTSSCLLRQQRSEGQHNRGIAHAKHRPDHTHGLLFPNFTNPGYCYTVSTAVKDTDGHALVNALSNYFYTGSGQDTAQPQVSSITPPNATTNIGTNAPIQVRFNKLVNNLTVSTSTVQVTTLVGGTPTPIAPMSISFVNLGPANVSTTDVLFTPINILPDNAVINVAIANVQDLAGNNIVPFTSSFTTQTGPDLSAPRVISTNPISQQTVPNNSVVALNFNEPIDPLTITNQNSVYVYDYTLGSYLTGTWSVSQNALSASFTPTDSGGNTISLGVGRQFQLAWNGNATNLVGTALQGGSLNFYTSVTPSALTPQVTYTNPENNQTGVPINGVIQVLFNEPVQSSSVSDVTLGISGTPVSGVVNTLSLGNTLLTLTPPALLKGGAQYGINVAGVKDAQGNVLTPAVATSFTTAPGADLSFPTVTSYNPPNGFRGVGINVNPVFVFSKRMDVISFNPSTIAMYNANTSQYTGINIVPSADRKSVTIQPTSPLSASTEYCFQVNGVYDLVGNPVYSTPCFYTGLGTDTTSPVITQMDPPNGATAAINVTLQFYASKQINQLTFNAATAVQLKTTTGNTPVAGTATLASDLQTITFKPAANLAASTSYTVTVSGFSDITGNLLTPFTGQFTTNGTGIPDTVQPIITSTNPAAQRHRRSHQFDDRAQLQQASEPDHGERQNNLYLQPTDWHPDCW